MAKAKMTQEATEPVDMLTGQEYSFCFSMEGGTIFQAKQHIEKEMREVHGLGSDNWVMTSFTAASTDYIGNAFQATVKAIA